MVLGIALGDELGDSLAVALGNALTLGDELGDELGDSLGNALTLGDKLGDALGVVDGADGQIAVFQVFKSSPNVASQKEFFFECHIRVVLGAA